MGLPAELMIAPETAITSTIVTTILIPATEGHWVVLPAYAPALMVAPPKSIEPPPPALNELSVPLHPYDGFFRSSLLWLGFPAPRPPLTVAPFPVMDEP